MKNISIRKLAYKNLSKVKSAFLEKANFDFRKISQFRKIFNKKEIWAIYFFIFLIIGSSIYLSGQFYLSHTNLVPQKGGHYIEGIAGEPCYVNPILCQTNETDEDLSTIIFSGLFSYDSEGNLILDLAESYSIGDFGKIYDIVLKKNIQWHDGAPLTTDDIIFTIQLIQDPNYKSPLKTAWQSIEVEKIDEITIRFKLKESYAPFLTDLTFGILPKHIWEHITSNNFPLAKYNLKPIGSGPYKFVKFVKDKEGKIKSFELEANEDYYLQSPFIEKITFQFYSNEEELLAAYNKEEIFGFNYLELEKIKRIENFQELELYEINIPRFFACFLNQTKSKALTDKTVRLALSYAVDKKRLIENVLGGKGQQVETPLLPYLLGYNSQTKIYDFAPEHSRNILEAAGWQDKDGDGIREKGDVRLKFKLTKSQWPALVKTIEELSQMWQEIGIDVESEFLNIPEIKNCIKSRDYEILLFGEVIGSDPDTYSYWHSSQRKYPGLNLSLYSNEEVDKLLEDARLNLDSEIRIQKYQEFQEIVVNDIPVIFLYSPIYLYGVNKKVKGIETKNVVLPSKRFSQIENWYIEMKRVWE